MALEIDRAVNERDLVCIAFFFCLKERSTNLCHDLYSSKCKWNNTISNLERENTNLEQKYLIGSRLLDFSQQLFQNNNFLELLLESL